MNIFLVYLVWSWTFCD